MKKLISTAVVILMGASMAYAVDERNLGKSEQSEDVQKACRGFVRDGKMTDGIPSDMIAKCKEALDKDNGAQQGPNTFNGR